MNSCILFSSSENWSDPSDVLIMGRRRARSAAAAAAVLPPSPGAAACGGPGIGPQWHRMEGGWAAAGDGCGQPYGKSLPFPYACKHVLCPCSTTYPCLLQVKDALVQQAVGCSLEDADPSHGVAGTGQPCWWLSLQCVLLADVCYCLFLAFLITLRGKLKLQRETPEQTRTGEAAEGKLPAGSTFCRCSLFTHSRALQPHGAVESTRGAETNREGLL